MNVISSYTDEVFKKHYSISRCLFKILNDKFGESGQTSTLRKTFSCDEHLYLFLGIASHEACNYILDLSDIFNATIFSVSRIIKRVTYILSTPSPHVIKWPKAEER